MSRGVRIWDRCGGELPQGFPERPTRRVSCETWRPASRAHPRRTRRTPSRSNCGPTRSPVANASLTRRGSMLGDRRTSMAQIAAAADVGRSTLYRHFPTRRARRRARGAPAGPGARDLSRQRWRRRCRSSRPDSSGRAQPLAARGHARARRGPSASDRRPARRRGAPRRRASPSRSTSSTSTARSWSASPAPRTSPSRSRRRPRSVPRSCPRDCRRSTSGCNERCRAASPSRCGCAGACSACCCASGSRSSALEDIAKQGAAALELANDYTDLIEAARRRKPTTAAAEVQHHLLPPRIARVTGAQLAGGLLPTYEVGGDWFDFVENRDGAWLVIADAAGTRSDRGRARAPPRSERCGRHVAADETSSARRRRWTRSSARSGTPTSTSPRSSPAGTRRPARSRGSTAATRPATSSSTDGRVHRARRAGPRAARSGQASRRFETSQRPARPGRAARARHRRHHRARPSRGGGTFGLDGVRAAVAAATAPTAAATAMAILHAVAERWTKPLQDDATLVVLAVD